MGIIKEYAGLVSLVCVLVLGGVVLTSSPTEVLGGKGVSDFSSVNVKSGGAYTLADTSVIDSSRNGSFVSMTATGATILNGGLTMDTNKFTVADATGNTSIGGTLGVTGTTTITGATSINNNATVKCPIFYDGATTSVAYYSYVSGDAVIATTTKPALCN